MRRAGAFTGEIAIFSRVVPSTVLERTRYLWKIALTCMPGPFREYIGPAVRVYERNETVLWRERCWTGEASERGDSILYFFRTRFSVTSNLDYTVPHHATPPPPSLSPRRSRRRDRNFILFAVRPGARSLAYVSFVSSSPKFSMKIAVYRAET